MNPDQQDQPTYDNQNQQPATTSTPLSPVTPAAAAPATTPMIDPEASVSPVSPNMSSTVTDNTDNGMPAAPVIDTPTHPEQQIPVAAGNTSPAALAPNENNKQSKSGIIIAVGVLVVVLATVAYLFL